SLRRHVTSGLMTGLVAALSFAAVLALVLILGDLIAKGASSLRWDFFTQNPVPAGQTGGGVANAIVGTGIVVGLAALIGLPIGIGTGLYLAEYGSGPLGCLVGIARIAGETAPLLFTALGNLNFSTSVLLPMQTLSLQIFTYATGPFEEWHRLAWAAAIVLMGLVLLLGVAARWAIRQGHGAAR